MDCAQAHTKMLFFEYYRYIFKNTLADVPEVKFADTDRFKFNFSIIDFF
jgi:hypothetical protein